MGGRSNRDASMVAQCNKGGQYITKTVAVPNHVLCVCDLKSCSLSQGP